MNTTIDTDNAAFLPKISLNRPYSGWKLVDVSKKAAGTQETIAPASKASEIVGSAVATTTESSAETTMQSAKLRNTMTILSNGSKLVWSASVIRSPGSRLADVFPIAKECRFSLTELAVEFWGVLDSVEPAGCAHGCCCSIAEISAILESSAEAKSAGRAAKFCKHQPAVQAHS